MILYAILALCVVQTLLLIAIAGSVAKVVGYIGDGSEVPIGVSRGTSEDSEANMPEGPMYRMENGELVQVGAPTYDQAILRGEAEPYADGITDRPQAKNWDGIPRPTED